jgi:hypothetical protein
MSKENKTFNSEDGLIGFKVYGLTKKAGFARDFGLKGQIYYA